MTRDTMRYGYHIVGQGRLKGSVVYYDDDYGAASIIVYPGAFRGGYFIIPARFIEREATELEIKRHERRGKSIAQYTKVPT